MLPVLTRSLISSAGPFLRGSDSAPETKFDTTPSAGTGAVPNWAFKLCIANIDV
jgi:hypothetical protein